MVIHSTDLRPGDVLNGRTITRVANGRAYWGPTYLTSQAVAPGALRISRQMGA